MKRLSALVLAVTLAAPALAQDRPQDYTVTPTAPGAVKVCQWNCQWFPSGSPTPKPAKEEAKRTDSAARFLAWQKADVVMLEEVRDAAACSNLVANPALAKSGFKVNACSQFREPFRGAASYHQNAIISRFDTVDSGWTKFSKGEEVRPPRGLTWAVLDVNGELWAFVCVHLKSNYIHWSVEDPDGEAEWNAIKREESARQLVAFAKANLEGKHYDGRKIVNIFFAGDFNTDPAQGSFSGEQTIPTVLGAGYADAFGNVPENERQTMPESQWPASRFDYIFHKGSAKLLHPEVAPRQWTSDHLMISVQVKGK